MRTLDGDIQRSTAVIITNILSCSWLSEWSSIFNSPQNISHQLQRGWCLYENWGQLNGCVWELTRGQKLQERRWWGGHDHFDEEDMIILMRRTGLFWWGGQDYFDEEDRIICRIHKIAETLPVLFCWQSLVFYSSHCNKNYVWSWMEQPSLCRLQIHKLTLVHFFIL